MAKTVALLAGIAVILSLGLLLNGTESAVAQVSPNIGATPTPTPKPTPTSTPKPTPTSTPKPTPTSTPKPTPTSTPKPTPTSTPKAGQGCTPGFWKNHTGAWPSAYSPSQTVGSVFSSASAFPSLASASLAQALAFQGGPGAEGAAQILLRAAVASLLNSAALSGYPFSTSSVISMTNTALSSGDRGRMLSLASDFDRANNLGCPLN